MEGGLRSCQPRASIQKFQDQFPRLHYSDGWLFRVGTSLIGMAWRSICGSRSRLRYRQLQFAAADRIENGAVLLVDAKFQRLLIVFRQREQIVVVIRAAMED